MSDVIWLTETSRLLIEQDSKATNPRGLISVTGAYRPLGANRPFDGPPQVHKFPGNLERAHQQLFDDSELEAEAQVQRWARVMYGINLVWSGTCYWFCDRNAWHEMVGEPFDYEDQGNIIAMEKRRWEAFDQGRMERVSLERLSTFERLSPMFDGAKPTLYAWEKVGGCSVGSVVLAEYEDNYARVVADHFAPRLNNQERAVIQAMLDSNIQNPEGNDND